MRVGDDRVGDRAAEVVLLHRVGHGALLREQEAGAHRDAGRAVRERGDEAAPVEEAARGDHRDVDRVDDLREQQRGRRPRRCGRRPRRPARSPRRRPTPRPSRRGGARRSTARPRCPRPSAVLIWCSRGASANDATFTLFADRAARRARRRLRRRRAGSRRTAGRCAPCTSRIAARELVVGHRRRREDPERARVRGRADEPRARDPAHAGLHDRHVDAEQVADRRAEASRIRDFLLAQAVRVDDLADPAQLVVGRAAAYSGTSPSIASSKPVAATTSSTVTPGCTERSRIRWSGVSKSQHAEVRDDAHDLVEAARARAELGGAVVADAAHDVDRGHEHARRVARDPVRRLVVDRVAGRAAHAEQLRASAARAIADEREVLVAVLVDLARRPSSRGGGPTTPRRTSCGTGSSPTTTFSGASTPTGRMFSTSSASPSVITSCGRERRLGQPAADHRQRADRVGEDLAVVRGSSRRSRPRTPRRGSAAPSRCVMPTPPVWYSASVTSMYLARNSSHASSLFARRGVRLLERFVARVVGDALGEVRAVRRLDHAVGHQPVDADRLRRAFLQEVVGVDDAARPP